MSSIRLSSNWTLILRLFVPLAWLSFFGSFLLITFLANPVEAPEVTRNSFRLGLGLFIVGGLLFFYFTVLQLKRVDADAQFIYVTNYFKTYRYTLDSIEQFRIRDHLLFKTLQIILKEQGKFGKRIVILPKMIHFKLFVDELDLQHLLDG